MLCFHLDVTSKTRTLSPHRLFMYLFNVSLTNEDAQHTTSSSVVPLEVKLSECQTSTTVLSAARPPPPPPPL